MSAVETSAGSKSLPSSACSSKKLPLSALYSSDDNGEQQGPSKVARLVDQMENFSEELLEDIDRPPSFDCSDFKFHPCYNTTGLFSWMVLPDVNEGDDDDIAAKNRNSGGNDESESTCIDLDDTGECDKSVDWDLLLESRFSEECELEQLD